MDVSYMPVIAGITITTDDKGRFSLNALHKASGEGSGKQPSNWLRLYSTQALVEELVNSSDMMSLPVVRKEGSNGGTFAHELLAISYAGWISPSFQLQVNQTFLDYKTGKLQPIPADDNDLLARAVLVARQQLDDKNRTIQEQQNQIEQDRPKVEFHDSVTASDQEVSVQEAAKLLGTGSQRLFHFLREYGYLMMGSRQPTDRNLPYQRYIDQGFFTVRLKSFNHPDEGRTEYSKTMVTGKGLVRLGQHLREIEIRQQLELKQERSQGVTYEPA
ncbi:phage antirepressor KilAC domain-containing protein [Endozoicomonas lisbonensis]|uniref:Anti-repressor protein n=1 Tax=Endozoicomonas lisbonensis TaxID=3120522 RepID=A0ABV2SFK7_9GAMM